MSHWDAVACPDRWDADTSEEQPVTFIFYERKSAKIDKLVPLLKAGFTEAFLWCDTRCDRRETGKTPNRSHVAAHATAATGPSQKLSLAQLLRCDAMRQAIWCTILTFSTAKLYKGARVAYKFLQVVSNRANIMVTYPNQQNFVASLTSSVNGISRVRIARIHRRSRRIACRIAKKLLWIPL